MLIDGALRTLADGKGLKTLYVARYDCEIACARVTKFHMLYIYDTSMVHVRMYPRSIARISAIGSRPSAILTYGMYTYTQVGRKLHRDPLELIVAFTWLIIV